MDWTDAYMIKGFIFGVLAACLALSAAIWITLMSWRGEKKTARPIAFGTDGKGKSTVPLYHGHSRMSIPKKRNG